MILTWQKRSEIAETASKLMNAEYNDTGIEPTRLHISPSMVEHVVEALAQHGYFFSEDRQLPLLY